MLILAGNPNAGKTLLFNRLTGLRGKVANYPGITVDYRKGKVQLSKYADLTVVDLPGTYSLKALSEDEELAVSLIHANSKEPSVIVAVVDATQLERNLYLVSQLLELERPMLIALTMMDIVERDKTKINMALLRARIGVPVVPISSATDSGVEKLLEAAHQLLSSSQPNSAMAISERSPQERYQQINHWLDGVVEKDATPNSQKKSDAIDKIILHPWLGPVLLLSIFGILFEMLFVWSRPVVDSIESFIAFFSQLAEKAFPTDSLLGSLVANGVIAGVGSVVAFVPLIALLFFFMGILEDSGYLARATFLLDRLMGKVGLPGRAFVPLLSGFACAIPAILATRVMTSKRDRLVTIFITPFMSCSARLPIYGLMIAAVFSTLPPVFGFIEVGALVMVGMYLLGIIVAFATAWVLQQFWGKGERTPLILELPAYRMPRLKSVLQGVWLRVTSFMKEVGTIILAITILLWALFSFPHSTGATEQSQLEYSYAGQLGKLIEPVIAPLGFDWKIGIGLVASFAAREVLVSTLGVIYGLGNGAEGDSVPLRQAILRDTRPKTGKPIYTPLTALSLMVFFALSLQCMSTFAATRRETKSWKWPTLQFGYMTLLAWTASLVIYQTGSHLGFS